MKTNSLKILVLFIPALTLICCNPVIKPGNIIVFDKGNYEKFWDADQAIFETDSVVLLGTNSSLVSKFKTEDFSFSAEFYTTENAEGSLDFAIYQSDSLTGYSVKINNSEYRNGSAQKTGSLSLIRNNFVRTASNGKWFTLSVNVQHKTIRVSVNNKVISEYDENDHPFRIKGLGGRKLHKGKIRIIKTSENGIIAFRNIKIQGLTGKNEYAGLPVIATDSTTMMIDLLNQQEFPLIDFHGHLKGGLTVDQIALHGRTYGYNYGIAPNCGLNFPVTNDSSLNAFYDQMAGEPVFKAMQCEGREWITLFSPAAIARYDYIFTDAMTWTDMKGRRMRLWIPEETFVDNDQQFMDMLVGKIESELSQEPVDIYVNPTYLPDILAKRYNELWTEDRMDRVIKVLTENDVSLEINSRFRIPSLAFVKRAKEAGVKFTVGTNNAGRDDLGRLDYSLWIIHEAGINASDMFLPEPDNNKKVLKKGLPAKITG